MCVRDGGIEREGERGREIDNKSNVEF